MTLDIHTRYVPFHQPSPARLLKGTGSGSQTSHRLRAFEIALGELPDNVGRSYVDLGAGPMIFARRAQKLGFQVTAVDARPPWLGTVPEGIDYINADLRSFSIESFDVIGIVGVLYHLTLEEQIDLLRRCEGRPTIVDTEVWCAGLVEANGLGSPRVEPAPSQYGYTGAILHETGDVWSSFGNPLSYWLDEPSILKLFAASGWRSVTLLEPPYFSRFGRRRWYVLQ